MPKERGGFLIRFDENQRTTFLNEIRGVEAGFSDALSQNDWELKQWEVCGLLFEEDVITHWALARKGKKVATGKVCVYFTEVTPIRIRMLEVEQRIGPQFRRNIVSARSGVGGRVPSGTWEGLKRAVGEIDATSLAALERLERLRDQSLELIDRPGAEIVAKQRDAVGLALDIFDQSGYLRKRTLQGWTAPDGQNLKSFLDGLRGVRTIEDQLIARDAAVFPETNGIRHTVVGAVFSVGRRKLEVFNVNRTAVETSLGVDLLYWNEPFDAWALVQYKSMEKTNTHNQPSAAYRPDAAFDEELGRMHAFRASQPDFWETPNNPTSYRLCGDGFFFKICSRVQLEVLSESLLPGMYFPRLFVEAVLASPATKGPRGGSLITFDNTERHISNTLFAELVRDGWIGTRCVSSEQVASIVRNKLTSGQAIVLARSRPPADDANPNHTLAVLDI